MVVQPMPGVKVRLRDNDIICKINRNSHMKCCGIFYKWSNTWKVLKCGAGEGWRRSVGPIM